MVILKLVFKRPHRENSVNQIEQSSSAPAARAVDLTKIYGKGDAVVRALDGVSVEFERGRFTAVMGPSGSGKSTLMHCMAGLDVPTAGQRFVGDQEIGSSMTPGSPSCDGDRIGFVFQSFNLVPTLTAGENITLPCDLAGQTVDRAWFDYLVGQLGHRRPAVAPPERAVRRPAAADRLRAGAGRPARADLRRRADRQPRLERLRRGAGVPAPVGDRARPVDRDGHPRSPGGGLRRPGRVPRRWPGRGRAASRRRPTRCSSR